MGQKWKILKFAPERSSSQLLVWQISRAPSLYSETELASTRRPFSIGMNIWFLRRYASSVVSAAVHSWPQAMNWPLYKISWSNWLYITMTSQWARWRLKSPASRLFIQPFIQRKHEKLRATGLCAGNSPETGEIPAQVASNPFDDVIMNWFTRSFDFTQF